jgi:ElaB/YqjD/DUF883 family membrane-anchored ribosome-binding protein
VTFETMTETSLDTRLSLMEQSVEDMNDTLKQVLAEMKEMSQALPLVRQQAAQDKARGERTEAQVEQLRVELNARMDRHKAACEAERKQTEQTTRTLIRWQGAITGAGAVVGILLLLVGFVAKNTLTDIENVEARLRALEIKTSTLEPRS